MGLQSQTLQISQFVPHALARGFWGRLDQARDQRARVKDPTEIKHLLVPGRSGMGKTLAAKNYPPLNAVTYGEERDVRPVAFMQMPSPFSIGAFRRGLLACLDVPLINPNARLDQLLAQAITGLMEQSVELLIIDEAHHIYGTSGKETEAVRAAMDNIKYLANESGVALVLLGTPKIMGLRRLDEQYDRRFLVYQFRPYQKVDRDYCEFLFNLGRRVGLGKENGVGDPRTEVPQTIYSLTSGLTWKISDLVMLMGRMFSENPAAMPMTPQHVKAAYDAWREMRGEA